MTQNATEADFDAIDATNTELFAEIRRANELVYEDDEVVVLYDHEYTEVDEMADAYDVERSELLHHMRELAPTEAETHFASGGPIVVKKPQEN